MIYAARIRGLVGFLRAIDPQLALWAIDIPSASPTHYSWIFFKIRSAWFRAMSGICSSVRSSVNSGMSC